jgi:hypothetical protein
MGVGSRTMPARSAMITRRSATFAAAPARVPITIAATRSRVATPAATTAIVGVGQDGVIFVVQGINRVGDLLGGGRQAVVGHVSVNFGERRCGRAVRRVGVVGPGRGDGERPEGCCGDEGRQTRLQHCPELLDNRDETELRSVVTASHKLVTHSPSACAKDARVADAKFQK